MKVVIPTLITAAALLANSVPETDYPEWDASATYAQGTMVQKAATHRVYESVLGGNKGNDPAATASTQWFDAGPTNPWAMFDQVVGTRTTGTGSISVTLAPGAITSLALLDTNANSVRVQMTDPNGIILYDRTRSSIRSGTEVTDWRTFLDQQGGRLQVLTLLDLPYYAKGRITVTINGPDPNGPVYAGTLIVGSWAPLGDTETGGSVGFKDFSLKNTDDFGNVSVVKRGWSKQFDLKAIIDIAWVDGIQRQVAELRGMAVLWLGEEGFDSLSIYGFATSFKVDFTTAKWSYVSLTVEGLV